MSCCEFCPVIERFCSNPKDFESSGQIIQMATFFGMKGSELKKVRTMALREEVGRR
jgi:hypothetical protein